MNQSGLSRFLHRVMMSNQETIRLSVEEAEYISHLILEDDSFASLLRCHPNIRVDGRDVSLGHNDAQILRDHFTDRLARVGFDVDYRPNMEGVLLEKLIDTFYRPTTK
jgi:hypothetical protein